MLWSETLFVVEILVFIYCVHTYFTNANFKNLLMMALVAAIATITRFAGVTLIMTGGLLLLLDNRLSLQKKFKEVFIFGCVSSSLLIINFPAQALTINESPNQPVTSTTTVNTSEPPATAPESLAPSPLPKWVTKTQLTFDKAFTKTQTAIADLASQLEEAATTTDVVVQKQIKKSLENKPQMPLRESN
jgi:hypothetical protein